MNDAEILKQSDEVIYAIAIATGAFSAVARDGLDVKMITGLEKAAKQHTEIVRELLKRIEELERGGGNMEV